MSVLWDVVRLREQGRRLTREVLQATQPVRGLLQLNARRPGWHAMQRDAPLLAGLVLPGESSWVIPPLDQARVKVIRAENMLIVGVEEFDLGRNRIERHRQAWWCRVVLPDATTVPGDAELDDDEMARPLTDLGLAWAGAGT